MSALSILFAFLTHFLARLFPGRNRYGTHFFMKLPAKMQENWRQLKCRTLCLFLVKWGQQTKAVRRTENLYFWVRDQL